MIYHRHLGSEGSKGWSGSLPRLCRASHAPKCEYYTDRGRNFSVFSHLACCGAGAVQGPPASRSLPRRTRAPPRTKPQCDLKRACFNYMIASRPTPSGYSPPRASSASGRTCRSEWACRSRRMGSCKVEGGEIGGFGGGKLEHLRQRLGAQWAGLSPESVEPARAARRALRRRESRAEALPRDRDRVS